MTRSVETPIYLINKYLINESKCLIICYLRNTQTEDKIMNNNRKWIHETTTQKMNMKMSHIKNGV